jgi:hypothetical protein
MFLVKESKHSVETIHTIYDKIKDCYLKYHSFVNISQNLNKYYN